ncbi:hypothetical protein FACS189467_2750 [Bacteroidia bacterium]|nr:hypothetical protein FACS189467_2750 [Bacteroidia bacterium]
MDLDAAIKEAAVQMGENLPAKTEVALVSVASSSTQFSEYVISRLEAALVSGKKLVVVDRANLDKIREEQGFQLSGEVDDKSAKDIGKILGAGAIVTGSFINLGDMYGLSLKAINMKTAAIAVSYPADIARSTRIETLLASGSNSGTSGARTAQTPRTSGNTLPALPSATKTYKVGDIGPAGGIVFYDKFNSAGGWRYLEVAPASTEQTMEWGLYNATLGSTQTGLGAGKQNTQRIAEKLHEKNEYGRAGEFCELLEYDGYDDWFLPSKDELNLVYQNLKVKGIGSFRGDVYWSSSEDGWAYAWYQNFSNGEQGHGGGYPFTNGTEKNRSLRVRAIRQF